MLLDTPQSFVGQSLLSGFVVDRLVHSDDTLATFCVASPSDASTCSLRLCANIEVPLGKDHLLDSSLSRISRHAIGIPSLCPIRAIGVVPSGFRRHLAVVHAGSPDDAALERIETGRPLALTYLLRSLRPIALALGSLHDQGMHHGCLQPSMVHLLPSGGSLSGFGLSEVAAALGGPSGAKDCMPLRYRAPEQCGLVPSSPSHESDAYLFALIASELLAGRTFSSETDAYTLARIIDDPLERPTPRRLGAEVSDIVEELFAAALRVNPRERLADPRRFLAELERSASIRPAAILSAPPQEASPSAEPSALQEPSSLGPSLPSNLPESHSSASPEPVQPPPASPEPVQPPPASPPRPKASPTSWLVYASLGLGFLLLTGGIGAAFWYVLSGKSSTSGPFPATSSSSLAPPSPEAPSEPELPADADLPDASADSSPSASDDASSADASSPDDDAALSDRDSSSAFDSSYNLALPSAKLPSGAGLYPEDQRALIPVLPHNAILGSRDSLVTIVLFADLQCPYTRRARTSLDSLFRRASPELRIVVKHLPIPVHPKAMELAEFGAAVHGLSSADALWLFMGKTLENPQKLDLPQLYAFASESGLAQENLAKAIKTRRFDSAVRADIALAGALMVRSTPTLFVNGKRVDGALDLPALDAIIKHEHIAAKAIYKSLPRSSLYATRVQFNVTVGESGSD